jgi:hypothetical protein
LLFAGEIMVHGWRRRSLSGGLLCFIVLFNFGAAAGSIHTPREFKNPYHDGYVLTLWNSSYTDEELDQILQRIKTAGARHVSVAHFGCQTDLKSADVDGCENRPYDLTLRAVVRAQQLGFDVSLLPLMATRDWKWRGYFDPTDLNLWFENYTKWITKIAADAEKLKLNELVVGSEFSILQKHTDKWRAVIQEVKKVFSGPIVFTVNWDSLKIGFWDEADAIGVSAYFSLSKSTDPTQKELDKGWEQRKQTLIALSNEHSRPIHITEFGYTNTNTTASTPWYTAPDAKRDDQLQARCFEAFRRNWKSESKLVRANVWSVNEAGESKNEITGSPIGKPAEGVLKEYFERKMRKSFSEGK